MSDFNANSADVAGELPSVFVNRFHIAAGPVLARMVFGEALVGTDANCRFALAMTRQDAVALANLILSLVKESPNAVSE